MTVERLVADAGPEGVQDVVVGYRLVLPSEWRHVRLEDQTGLDTLLDEAFEKTPGQPGSGTSSQRRTLRRLLEEQFRVAHEAGAVEAYLPVALLHGVPVAASMVVGVLETGSPAPGPDSARQVLEGLSAAQTASEQLQLDGSPAVRLLHFGATVVQDATGTARPVRRLDYVVQVPGAAHRWLSINCSVVEVRDPAGTDLTPLLIDLFDAIISTFRWER